MWRNKKFIIIAMLTVLVLAGTIGGVAIAQANDDNYNLPQTGNVSLLDKVAENYEKNTGVAIDAQELKKAFTEAGQAIRDEALDNYLQKLVTDGKITQEQADQFKAWLESRPTFPTDEFKQWWDARPDIPGLFGQDNDTRMGPFGGMHRGIGKFGGGFGERFGGWCAPDANNE
jgi:hypothetical protein